MSKDRPVRCPINANVPRGPVKYLVCDPSCPHYLQSKRLESTLNPGDRRGKRALQKTAREGGRFGHCPNPWLYP